MFVKRLLFDFKNLSFQKFIYFEIKKKTKIIHFFLMHQEVIWRVRKNFLHFRKWNFFTSCCKNSCFVFGRRRKDFWFLLVFVSSDVFIIDSTIIIIIIICSLHSFFFVCQVLCFCVVTASDTDMQERFLPYTPSNIWHNLLSSRFHWGRHFSFECCRASHRGSNHRPGPSVCLNHTVFSKCYYLMGSIYLLEAATYYYINYLSLVLNSLYSY